MNKSVLALILLLGVVGKSWAGLSSIGEDIMDNTKVTILQSANVAYFYDLGEGTDKNSQAGLLDHVITYRFLSASVGWRTPTVGASGILVAGPSFRLDKLLAQVAPEAVGYLNSFIPDSAKGFWDSLFAGIDTGWSVDDASFKWAFHTGISYKF